jgi:hypothetical protein
VWPGDICINRVQSKSASHVPQAPRPMGAANAMAPRHPLGMAPQKHLGLAMVAPVAKTPLPPSRWQQAPRPMGVVDAVTVQMQAACVRVRACVRACVCSQQ